MRKILFTLFFSIFTYFLFAQVWNKVGTGVNGVASALGIFQDELYFGGSYSTSPFISIAKWDGSLWTPVDSASGFPYCFLEYNNELYVGGNFSSIQGAGSYGIAKWNGTQWMALSSGINIGATYIKDIAAFNGEIYVSGRFWNIGGVSTRGIAKWNGTNWLPVGGGLQGCGNYPRAQALANFKNDLFVGGEVCIAGTLPVNCIAKWNNITWDSLGSGVNSDVNAMVVDTINNFLFLSGLFIETGGKEALSVAKWNGFEMDSVGKPFGHGKTCMEMYHGQLYVGGYDGTGGLTDTILIRWDGKQWYNVIGPLGGIETLQTYKDKLYVGGGYFKVGIDSVIGIAAYSAPWDTNCKFLQPIIVSMNSLVAPNGVANTFYYTDSVKVQFYNNIQSASSWQWNFGDGETGTDQTPIHYYNSNGTYNVSVVVSYPWGPNGNCIDTAQKTITVTHVTDIEKLTNEKQNFKLYPNPTDGSFTIELLGKISENTEIKVYKLIEGIEVAHFFIKNEKQILFSTEGWSSGIYFVELYSGNKLLNTDKLVIK